MKKNYIFYMANIILPLIIGGFLYYLFEPDIIYVRYIDELTKLNFHIKKVNYPLVILFRYYGFDILWAYSLVFILLFILGNETAGIRTGVIIACVFSIMMEILQISVRIPGTFDIVDILVEILSEMSAVFIIKKHVGGRYEKNN